MVGRRQSSASVTRCASAQRACVGAARRRAAAVLPAQRRQRLQDAADARARAAAAWSRARAAGARSRARPRRRSGAPGAAARRSPRQREEPVGQRRDDDLVEAPRVPHLVHRGHRIAVADLAVGVQAGFPQRARAPPASAAPASSRPDGAVGRPRPRRHDQVEDARALRSCARRRWSIRSSDAAVWFATTSTVVLNAMAISLVRFAASLLLEQEVLEPDDRRAVERADAPHGQQHAGHERLAVDRVVADRQRLARRRRG